MSGGGAEWREGGVARGAGNGGGSRYVGHGAVCKLAESKREVGESKRASEISRQKPHDTAPGSRCEFAEPFLLTFGAG